MPSLAVRWHSLIEGRGGLSRGLLRVASLGYGGGVALRNTLYDRKLFKTDSSPMPTISVGNLLLGGSGKTPLVRWIAGTLAGRVAILSRGYRSRAEKVGISTLVTADSSWEEVGDEPLMLAKSLPDALVIVSPNRVKGARFAQELGADYLLLDDGFQHRALARNLDIVCIPASTALEELSLFPRGPLREPLSALKRASLIVITECQDEIPPDLARVVRQYTSASQVGFSLEPRVEGGDIRGKRVAIFSGIARPERFRRTVEDLGGEVVKELILPDHGSPSAEDLQALRSSGAGIILCTEKDWVKGVQADAYISLNLHPLTDFSFDKFL